MFTFGCHKTRKGYITIIALMGVVALGSIFYGNVLNTKWVKVSRESHLRTERILLSEFRANDVREIADRRFYKTDENIVWWTFISRNVSPLKDMLRFKVSVRDFHKFTKDYVAQQMMAHLNGINKDIRDGNVYRKYMYEFVDRRNGILWVVPSFKNIPDSEKTEQDSYKEDSAAAYILPTQDNKFYYAKDDMTEERDIVNHYSASLGNPLFRNKIKLEMPFSQY